jgi:hypothetical protein
MGWYTTVTADLTKIDQMIADYEKELIQAKAEVKLLGSLEKNMSMLPGVVEYRFSQLQEIEAILNFLNIQLRKVRRTFFQKYLENYNRALTSRDAEKYTDGQDEVIDCEIMINEVSLIRNKYLGIMKALDHKGYMMGHITKLKVVGIDDASVG